MRALLVLAVLPACVFYDSGDDAIYCEDGGYVPYELVDPSTLTCQDFGSYQCTQALAVPIPTWGECDSPCRELDEASCLVTSGCRTTSFPSKDLLLFLGCWPVDQSGPVQGPCENLDATTCSMHDDCRAVYDAGNQTPAFLYCGPESP